MHIALFFTVLITSFFSVPTHAMMQALVETKRSHAEVVEDSVPTPAKTITLTPGMKYSETFLMLIPVHGVVDIIFAYINCINSAHYDAGAGASFDTLLERQRAKNSSLIILQAPKLHHEHMTEHFDAHHFNKDYFKLGKKISKKKPTANEHDIHYFDYDGNRIKYLCSYHDLFESPDQDAWQKEFYRNRRFTFLQVIGKMKKIAQRVREKKRVTPINLSMLPLDDELYKAIAQEARLRRSLLQSPPFGVS